MKYFKTWLNRILTVAIGYLSLQIFYSIVFYGAIADEMSRKVATALASLVSIAVACVVYYIGRYHGRSIRRINE